MDADAHERVTPRCLGGLDAPASRIGGAYTDFFF